MKNPWTSLWLSAANTWAGELRRLQTAMTEQMARVWIGAAMRPVPIPITRKRVVRR